MKPLHFTILVLVVCSKAFSESTYKLSEAIQKKLIVVSISGAKEDTTSKGVYSSHYGPCMSMEISSISSEALNLNLEYGYKLEPEDTSVQTMVVTQTLSVKLQPKQKKNYRIYAMCMEANDGGPSPERKFTIANRTTGNLLRLAELLNRQKYQGDAAQNAVWCLTDNHNIQSIFSEDTTMMYDLRRFVAKAKGIPLAEVYKTENAGSFSTTVRTFTSRTIYSGSLSYNIIRPVKVLIALFDEDNKMKRVYVNNETQHEGEYIYKYEIGSDEMESKKHYLRMFRGGRLEEEISIIPR